MDCSLPGSSAHREEYTGVGCHFLLQAIFPTQGSNSHLLHWQADSFLFRHLRSPWGTLIRSLDSISLIQGKVGEEGPR